MRARVPQRPPARPPRAQPRRHRRRAVTRIISLRPVPVGPAGVPRRDHGRAAAAAAADAGSEPIVTAPARAGAGLPAGAPDSESLAR